jgi:hypothetical protein
MIQTIYADGVSNITLVDGVVRLDLVKIAQLDKDKASVEPIAMLAISLPAFLRLHEQLKGAVAKMVDQGVLKKADTNATTIPPENIKFGN